MFPFVLFLVKIKELLKIIIKKGKMFISFAIKFFPEVDSPFSY
jgi:hypothetical protein